MCHSATVCKNDLIDELDMAITSSVLSTSRSSLKISNNDILYSTVDGDNKGKRVPSLKNFGATAKITTDENCECGGVVIGSVSGPDIGKDLVGILRKNAHMSHHLSGASA